MPSTVLGTGDEAVNKPDKNVPAFKELTLLLEGDKRKNKQITKTSDMLGYEKCYGEKAG